MLLLAALALSCRSSTTGKATPTPATASSGPALEDPRTWPRLDSVTFGCLLEKAGGAVAAAYRCGSSAAPPGDACTDAGAVPYYAGPEFPEVLVGKIGGPSVESVVLEWEHADLRMVMLVYPAGTTRDAILARFPLEPRAENLLGAEVTQCSKNGLCLVLTGFEHMGAADVDCGASP